MPRARHDPTCGDVQIENTFGYPLVQAKLQEWVAAQESEFTLSVQCVKGAKITTRIELDIRRGNCNDGPL